MEPGLLGASSFPEPVVLLKPSGEVWFSRVAARKVPVPVIEASSSTVVGLVFAFDWSCLRLTGPVEPGSELVVVVGVVLGPVLLPEPVGPEPLVVALAWQPAVFSILVCPWDLQSVTLSFPIARRSPRIFFLQM